MINASNILTGHSDSSASSFTTASVTLNPGYYYVLAVGADNGGTACPDPTISQTGVTWNENITEVSSSSFRRLTVFSANVASSVTNTATINFSSAIGNGAYWQITQFLQVNLINSIVQQTGSGINATTSQNLSFGSAPGAKNGGFAAIFLNGNGAFSGRTGIDAELANDAGNRRLETEYLPNGLVQTNCATWSWTGSESGAAIALELLNNPPSGFFQFMR